MRARGERVEVQNYIDNTGVQVADVVVGFHYLEHKSPDEVRQLIADPAVRFDYLCWDLYARTSAYYTEAPESRAWRSETLHAIEAAVGPQAELAHIVADAIVERHLATMLRLGVEYDVLPRESEILHLKFWASAFELLKERKAIYLETEGKNAGCWVMPAEAFAGESGAEDSKVIVRSDGTVTYVGKDIAYQLWKFGLLGKDFYYRPFMRYADGRELWISTAAPQPAGAPGALVRPRYARLQRDRRPPIVSAGRGGRRIEGAGLRGAGRPICALLLRDGGAVAALLRRVRHPAFRGRPPAAVCGSLRTQRAGREGRRPDRHADREGAGRGVRAASEATLEEQRAVSTQIAIGALRYFLLKFTRNSVIAFDFQEALSFEGETGPYVQYAAVRARNILRKLEEKGERLPDFAAELTPAALGAPTCKRRLLADAAGGVESRCGGGSRR